MKKLVVGLFCAVFPLFTNAQTGELGLLIGPSYYIGDINPSKHFYNAQAVVSAFGRYNWNDRFTFRLSFSTTNIAASDADSDIADQRNRNLSFRSPLREIAGVFELNFKPFAINEDRHRFSPYMYGGFSYFRMDPSADINGETVALQPLGTEGQNTGENGLKPYKLNQLGLPFGVGIKLNFAGRVTLSADWGMRKTYTDYMDDVSGTYVDPTVLSDLGALLADRSLNREGIDFQNNKVQRGNSANYDWYVFSGLSLSVVLFGHNRGCAHFDK